MSTITNPKTHKGLIALFLMALLFSFEAAAQNEVAIGSATTKSNAILWLNGNGSQGLILPVVTNKSAVSNPDKGMVVYDDSDNKVWYRTNSAWVEVGSGTGGSTANLNLSLQGNQLQLRDGTTVQNTVNIAGGSQSNGAFLVFTGGSWQYANLSGDVTGANGSLVVNGIKGKTIATLPATTQALVYDPSANSGSGGWIFQTFTSGGTVTNITGTAPVTVTNPTTTPTISIANGGITNTLLATDAVNASKIQDATITGADIAASTITADKLAQSAATTGQVLKWNGTNWIPQNDDAGTGTVPTLSNGQLLTGNGTTNSATTITGDATLSGGVITIGNNAITTAKINAAAVDATKLADNAVTSAKISDATITDADIANGTITASKLAQSAAASGQVLKWNGTNWVPAADDAGVGATPTLSNGQILVGNGTTNSAVALSGDATLAGGVITIGNNAITTAKINTAAVDATKLADNAVTSAKISDGSITGADLATNIAISTTGNVNVNAPGIISGIGSGLTTLNASNISSGSLALARITPGTNGQVLTTVAGVPAWQTSGAGATTLDGLTDATVTAASSGQILVNDGAGQFRNVSASGDATISNSGAVTLANSVATRTNLGLGTLATLSAVDLAGGNVTGILPVANGGTGRSTWDGLLLGSAGNISDISTGTAGQFLRVVGTSPSWQTFAVTSADITDGTITDADISGTAAIAGTKVNPTFGTQNISTSGTLSAGSTTVTGLTIGTSVWPANASGALTNDGTGILTWVAPASGWGLTGNAGTVDGTNFVGTTDNIPLNFRVNNQKAGRIDPTAAANTFLGYQSGNVSTGNENTGFGYRSLLANTTGNYNAAVGFRALASNTTGSTNTALGNSALASNTTASDNTAVGTQALSFNTGGSNSALGAGALLSNTTGFDNSAVGVSALGLNTTGSQNIAFGRLAGSGVNANTTGSRNTFLGYAAGLASTTQLTNATAIGANAAVDQSNSLVLGSISGVNGASSSTNVGIGTTTPRGKLEIQRGDLILSGSPGTPTTEIDPPDINFVTLANVFKAKIWTAQTTNTLWISTSTDPTNNRHLTLDPNGNFGIGTITPVNKLDVEGGMAVGATYSGTSPAPSNGLIVQGNVGIGATAPVKKLEVVSTSILADGLLINHQTNRPTLYFDNSTTTMDAAVFSGTGTTDGMIYSFGNAATSGFTFYMNMDLTGFHPWLQSLNLNLGTTTKRWSNIYLVNSPNVSSDSRLKSNIVETSYGLKQVMSLRPVSYYLKSEKEQNRHLGFIAQEVKKVIPELVEGNEGEDEFLSMRYSEMIPVLTKAIQEQQKQIEDLKMLLQEKNDKVNSLEGSVSSMRNELENIKQALGIQSNQKINGKK